MLNQLQKAVSEGMGKAREFKVGLKGLNGIFRALAAEHGQVEILLKRLAKTTDPGARAELFPTIRKELLAHERSEMVVLYPALRHHPETRNLADDHNRDALGMERMLDELHAMEFGSEDWGVRFEALIEMVESHARQEENEVFPAGQKAIGQERAEALTEGYLQTKQTILQEL